jgi:hypothetical protein
LLAASCSPQRKVQKAIHTVTYNDTAFDHVGKLWERFHPCFNDTFHIDTVNVPIFIDAEINKDSGITLQGGTTTGQFLAWDSTSGWHWITATPTDPGPGLRGWTRVDDDSTVRIRIPCPPSKTIVQVVRDTRHEQLIRDSLDVERSRRIRAESQLAGTGATIQDLRQNLMDQTKSFGGQLTKRTLIILIPAILIIALLLYALFKRRTIPI